MFVGANNAFTDKPGTARSVLEGEKIQTPSEVARDYKAMGLSWAVVGDENYGEGSSREHAAMSPRFLGCKAVLAKSFARIHETNLKKQGLLPLTFVNPGDYDSIKEGDRISLHGLAELAPGKPVPVVLWHKDGTSDAFTAGHSFTPEQLEWFKAGSALNLMKGE